jgi:hypothetical protein
MGTKIQWFDDKTQAASKMWADVGKNNVNTYDIPDYQAHFQLPTQPQPAADKWAGVTVAVSGEAATGRDWLCICPYRVDEEKKTGEKVYDLDPVLMVILDTNTGKPHPSGVAVFHQDFLGRTIPAPGFMGQPLDVSVSGLRQSFQIGVTSLQTAPPEVLSALQHMYNKFSSAF